jgi:hypothetical protein
VLNANFAEAPGPAAAAATVLGPRQALVAGRPYDLLVDVGPRWDKIESLVTGNAAFPEEALPPGPDGYVIEVMLVSEDVTPNIATAEIWLPRSRGRSFPIVDGRRAERPGPVALRVTAPSFPEGSDAATMTARARLSLYYEQNVLQSAVVVAGVGRTAGLTLEQPNAVEVDFSLTGGFQGVVEHFTTRSVRFTPDEPPDARHPVALSMTMNDDGGVGHRITYRGRLGETAAAPVGARPAANGSCPPFGFVPYDPKGMDKVLESARRTLLECFYAKDGRGRIVRGPDGAPEIGLDRNRKPRDQFLWDLIDLAKAGNRLRNVAMQQVRLGSSPCVPAQWTQSLLRLLASSSIIQVANTGPAQYVFPWTLVYEYVLEGEDPNNWVECKVIGEEWSRDGVRTAPLRTACPHQGASWHAYNVICPYGLWGLKHVIEEPPSTSAAQANAKNRINIGGPLTLAVSVTADPGLKAGVDAHLRRIAGIPDVRLEPATPASDWSSVKLMLQAPEIVYFLCHGELDAATDESYLSVGPRDNQREHRIYADDVTSWGAIPTAPPGPDLDAWSRRNPLVFINGCHTADLTPGQIQSFATAFAGVGASGVLGTEVSVLLPVAAEVAESLVTKLARPDPPSLGEALRQIRWELANKGNLLGLAYTLYALADLRVARPA